MPKFFFLFSLLVPSFAFSQAYSPIMIAPPAEEAPEIAEQNAGYSLFDFVQPKEPVKIERVEPKDPWAHVPDHYAHLIVPESVISTITNTNLVNYYGTLAPDLLEEVQHKVQNEELQSWGITDLLSVGVSDFSGSSRERIHNMKHVFYNYDGLIIKPGEEFSFLEFMGEVSEETGYKNSKVIYDGVSVDGVGGGICQASSTLYRAGLMAGLPITEHRSHSFVLPYYGRLKGLDATIWRPTQDIKWKNDTQSPIIVRTILRGSKIIVLLYGQKDRDAVLLLQKNDATFADGGKTEWTREIYKNGQLSVVESIKHEYIPFEKED